MRVTKVEILLDGSIMKVETSLYHLWRLVIHLLFNQRTKQHLYLLSLKIIAWCLSTEQRALPGCVEICVSVVAAEVSSRAPG